jgi:tetratricopeptide (TPR) repeat protein
MKTGTVSFILCAISGVFLFVVLFSPDRSLAYDFSGWYHGASGHSVAIEEAEFEEKPLVVYFHTEWCKWSVKMSNKYLASYDVDDFLSDVSKVEIDPDKGADEKALTNKYKVTGYPSFLISVPSVGSKNERVYPFLKNGTEWTTDQFLSAVRSKIVNVYNNKGYSSYKQKQYEEAIKYYEMALSYDPDDAYAYYGKGTVYYSMGYENRDYSLLEEAETDLQNALELDPDNSKIEKELGRLRELMEKVGIE